MMHIPTTNELKESTMNIKQLTVIALLTLVSAPTVASERLSIKGIAIGDAPTQAEVRAIQYPGFGKARFRKNKTGAIEILTTVVSVPVITSIRFMKGEVTSVSFEFVAATRDKSASDLVKALTSKYGEPDTSTYKMTNRFGASWNRTISVWTDAVSKLTVDIEQGKKPSVYLGGVSKAPEVDLSDI
jgi:hypothetical protein